MSKRKLAMIFSAILLLISIGSLVVNKLNFGIDFTGGTLIEVGYPDSVELASIQSTLAGKGFDDVIVQHFGNSKDVLIRVAPRDDVA